MERTTRAVLAVMAISGLAACGPPGPERAEVTVIDHADALTSNGGDNLFVLTLTKAAAPYLIGLAAETKGLGLALAITSLFFAVGGILVWTLPETRGTDLEALEAA